MCLENSNSVLPFNQWYYENAPPLKTYEISNALMNETSPSGRDNAAIPRVIQKHAKQLTCSKPAERHIFHNWKASVFVRPSHYSAGLEESLYGEERGVAKINLPKGSSEKKKKRGKDKKIKQKRRRENIRGTWVNIVPVNVAP